jgi:hypothetical protein
MQILFRNSVPSAQRARIVCVMMANRLLMQWKRVAACSEKGMRPKNALCGESAEPLNVRSRSMYSNHGILKGSLSRGKIYHKY